MYAGRVKHEPNEAVQRVEGGVEREDQGGEEGGQGEAQGDLEERVLFIKVMKGFHDDYLYRSL